MPAKSGADKRLDSSQLSGASRRSEDIIGDNLRRVYDEVAHEPLPERLEELLKQLQTSGKGVDDGSSQ